jgi:linoleoyl-CoA desaturase
VANLSLNSYQPTTAGELPHAGQLVDDTPPTAAMVWRRMLPTADELRAARRRLHGKAMSIAALLALSYYVLVVSNLPMWLRAGAALALVTALVAVGTGVMHDANHGSFSTHRTVNRVLAYTADVLGTSSWLWRLQHNVLHHGNTNVDGFDADIALAPWARLSPAQPWRPRFRWQHIYIWPLYGFLALKNLLVSDLLSLLNGRIGEQPLRQLRPSVVVRVVLGKLAHLGWAVVVPLMFNPWWGVVAFYVVCSWMVGFVLAMIFQLAHCVDAAEVGVPDGPRRGDEFAAHQLRTTVDIATPVPVIGHFFRWLAGGLDHQIEHHLAPGLPHTIYPKLAKRFRVACAEQGIHYRQHAGLWPALCSHARWLQAMGRPAPI